MVTAPLTEALRVHPAWQHSVALRTLDGWSMTFGELEDASRDLAAGFVAAGVDVGDRVVYQVHKSPKAVVLHLALLRCGAIQIPVNPGYAGSEVRGFLEDSQPVMLIRDPGCPDIEGPWQSLTLDSDGGGSVTNLRSLADPLPELTGEHGAAILFTSGTTGRPKGALLSHANLVHNVRSLVGSWEFTSSDHVVHVLPLFHTHGLFVALHCALASGATTTLLPSFDVGQVLQVMSGQPTCTVMMGVPTHYARLLHDSRCDSALTANMRLFISGSAPMSRALHAAFASRTGHDVLERYGMTETSMLTSNPVRGVRKPGAVGRPLPGVDVRVVDEAGGVLHLEAGSVEVRGPNVFAGYWGRPDLHDESFTSDGWFRTGDLGRFDADGCLSLVGRSKDLVISGGLNVYPADVESVLDAIPGVRESAVVGTPDPDLGERVVAMVVADSTSGLDDEQIRTMARTKLAGYQVPKQVILVSELPRNAMGKVEKSVVRERLAEAQ